VNSFEGFQMSQMTEAANGGVLQINCSAPSLKMRTGVEFFRNFPAEHINICQDAQKGGKRQRYSKDFL